MPVSATHQATCPGCARTFRIRGEAIGKRVKCNCGTIFEPHRSEPPKPVQVTQDDLERDSPSTTGKSEQQHGLGGESAVAVKALPPAALPRSYSAVAQALLNREDDTAESSLRERWVPIALLAIGLPLHYALWNVWLGDIPRLSIVSSIELAVQLFIFLPAMFGSLLLTARLLDVPLGTLPSMVWKMTALTLGPAAVADVLFTAALILADFDWQIIAAGFGFHLIWVGAAALYIFELNIAQMAFFVTLNFAVRVAAAYPAAAVLGNLKWID